MAQQFQLAGVGGNLVKLWYNFRVRSRQMTVPYNCYSAGHISPLKSPLQSRGVTTVHTLLLVLVVLVFPQVVLAECKEFKIVEYEDRVEAVCVGEPLTEAQKKANLEDEKRQEAAAQRQRLEEQKRQNSSDAAAAKAAVKAAEDRRKSTPQPGMQQKPTTRNPNNSGTINPIKF